MIAKDEVAVSQIVYQTADSQIVYEETEEFLGPAMPSFDIFVEVLGRYFQDIYKAKNAGRLYINGFEICDDKMSTYGWGVFLGPSVLDHSCRFPITTNLDVI